LGGFIENSTLTKFLAKFIDAGIAIEYGLITALIAFLIIGGLVLIVSKLI
jgi:Flp pilus assembly pilin Flp